MQISGLNSVHGPQGLSGPHTSARANQATRTSTAVADQLDISPLAMASLQQAESGDIRSDLVSRLKAEIASGSYETQAKLDSALNRLIDELG